MAKKLTRAQIDAKIKGGWFKKLWRKAKTVYHKHVKKHVRHAINHGKKVAKKAGRAAKQVAIDTGKQLLEEAKAQAKEALMDTINEATEAATSHVRKTVCGAVGAGFFDAEKKKLKNMANKHFDAVHGKALAHVKRGGKGAGIEDHANKAKARFEKGVENVKNSAKSKIRALAGCEEGSGLRVGKGMRVGKGIGKGKGVVRTARGKKKASRGGYVP